MHGNARNTSEWTFAGTKWRNDRYSVKLRELYPHSKEVHDG